MIIGDNFVWQHMPHTAGVFTATVLERNLGEQIIFRGSGEHLYDSFADIREMTERSSFDPRHLKLEGKLKVMNFRKLPDWAFARLRFIATEREMSTQSLPAAAIQAVIGSDAPDRMLHRYSKEGVDRYLLVDNLEEGLNRLCVEMGKIGSVSMPVHIPRMHQKIELSDEQLERLYWSNPEWARLEAKLYGELPDLLSRPDWAKALV